MHKFLLANFIVLTGLALAMLLSVSVLGYRRTASSLSVLSGRALAVFLPVDTFLEKTGTKKELSTGKVLSAESEFEISQFQPPDYQELQAPLLVPTNGIAAHKNFLYLPEVHPGIDIWTNADGSGIDGKIYGNPVYAACSGVVAHYKPANEEIEIICDPIPEHYKQYVPSLKVKILYSHLGDGGTLEAFHTLKKGQRVKRGEFVGYQGNKSSFVPENKVVHLHFGVYDLNKRKPEPLDPMYYIGVPTNKVGQVFTTETH